MNRRLALLMSYLVISAGLMFAGEPKAPAVAFTLAATGGNPGPISFTLAPGKAETRGLAGPGGVGVIEDINWPYNAAIGGFALASNTTGAWNTASGYRALFSNTEGQNNTAVGSLALESHTTGNANTATGVGALRGDTSGQGNTASGFIALTSNENGHYNSAYGGQSLFSNTSGQNNTAIGWNALFNNTIGYSNTAIGAAAGYSCVDGVYNIYLGVSVMGLADDTRTIRIGNPYSTGYGQNRTFIAGIVETPLVPTDVPAVVGITAGGRLGTMSADLLPPGPEGQVGPAGPQGPAGESLVPGSLLFMASGFAAPAGYALLGSTDITLTVPGVKRGAKITVNVYQKQ
jgi:hypothetical protein